MSQFERLSELYRSGSLSWDDPLPPPEVRDIVASLPAGRAIDLGCGYGRAALYLAAHGWQADGVDFVPQAIDEARLRARNAGLEDRARFHLAPVTQLDGMTESYDLAIDVGCAHGLEADELRAYQGELLRLLKPGARYLLFARINVIADAEPAEAGPLALDRMHLLELFSNGFRLLRASDGWTTVNEQTSWPSAWFWFARATP